MPNINYTKINFVLLKICSQKVWADNSKKTSEPTGKIWNVCVSSDTTNDREVQNIRSCTADRSEGMRQGTTGQIKNTACDAMIRIRLQFKISN
jgi:hypothetical protein